MILTVTETEIKQAVKKWLEDKGIEAKAEDLKLDFIYDGKFDDRQGVSVEIKLDKFSPAPN